jgi:tetratricopeptide (TPR) repeat protein
MGFQAAKCPSCAGDIQVPTDRDVVKCMYCGVDVVVREAIRAVGGPSAETLADLRRKALDAANPTDAFQLFSRALEADPKNVAALMGKGEAAGWCSTIANLRFQEMSTYFNDAIKLAAPDAQEGLKQRAARSIGNVSVALWSQAQERFQRFASLDQTWIEFATQDLRNE